MHLLERLPSFVVNHINSLRFGMQCALQRGMKINTMLLREISFQVSRGNPFWGALLANEYLGRECSLRRTLLKRAAGRLDKASLDQKKLFVLVENGTTAKDLPHDLRREVGSRVVTTARTIPTKKSVSFALHSRQQIARRQPRKFNRIPNARPSVQCVASVVSRRFL